MSLVGIVGSLERKREGIYSICHVFIKLEVGDMLLRGPIRYYWLIKVQIRIGEIFVREFYSHVSNSKVGRKICGVKSHALRLLPSM